MKKVIVIFIFVLSFECNGFSQGLDKTQAIEPILLHSFGLMSEDLSEAIYRVGNLTKSRMESNAGVFAIRVCSKDQLSIALAGAYGNPFSTVDSLEKNHSIPRTKMFFLRQDRNCKFYKSELTEYWFIPEKANFPEYVELKKASELFENIVVSYDYLFEKGKDAQKLTPELFNQTLDYVVESMKKNRTIFVSITVLYDKNPKSEMFKHGLKAKEYLQKNGISNYRIHMDKFSLQKSVESEKMNYPNIILVGEN